jgi:hypothetical protein
VPGGGAIATWHGNLFTGLWPFQATIVMHEPAPVVAEKVWPGMGAVEPRDQHSCVLHLGAESPADPAWMGAVIGVDFTVASGPPELAEVLRALGERRLNAV